MPRTKRPATGPLSSAGVRLFPSALVVIAVLATSVFAGLQVAALRAPEPAEPAGPGDSTGPAQPAGPAEPVEPAIYGRPAAAVVAELETLIPEAMEREDIAGLSIAVLAGGRLYWAAGFGVRDVATGEPVTAATIFRAASLSKNLTAYAALELVEQGILDLDRPLAGYVPGESYLPDPRLDKVTLRMILSHTSGFTSVSVSRGSIVREPGTRFSYASDSFRYLQWVIEHVTGEPFADYMREHLCEPLGMEGASFVWREDYDGLAATGYEGGGAVTPYRPTADEANAPGGAYLTPTDYARLLEALLQPVAADPYRLGPETVREVATSQAVVDSGNAWGLGWGLEKVTATATPAERWCLWQWGLCSGFRNLTVCDPGAKVAVVILTNDSRGFRVCREIVERVIPGEHALFPTFLKAWAKP